jgi:preprotein translocase subunit SecG
VSFLRLCSDGSLVDFTHGICPSAAPTAEPTEPITSSPTAVVTDPPTVAQANAARQFAESAAKTLSRNINVVIGVLAALFFTLLLLCCFHQYRRDKLINNAIKELSLPDDDLNISLGSSTELSGGSSLELSNLSFNESSVPSAFPPPHSPASPLKTPPGEQALFGTDSSFENWGNQQKVSFAIFYVSFFVDDHFPAPSLFSSVNVPPSMNVPPSSSDNPPTSSDDAVSSFSASSSSSAFRASSSNDLTASQMSAVWNLSAKAPAAVPKEIVKAPAAVARSSLVSTTADASSSSFNA